MKHLEMCTQVPALTRRDAFTAIAVAMVSATALGSPRAVLEQPRRSTSTGRVAKAAREEAAPFVLSF